MKIKTGIAIIAIFCFCLAGASPASAGKLKKFQGLYQGSAMLENMSGDSIFYDPIRFTVSKRGKISGSSLRIQYINYQSQPEVSVQISGKLKKRRVRKMFGGTIYSVPFKIRMDDGAIATGKLIFSQSGTIKSTTVDGRIKAGDYLGHLNVLK